MRTASRTTLKLVVFAVAASGAVVAGRPLRADDASGPPAAERVQLDESAGHVEEALAGWTARYLGVTTQAERTTAMQRYVALAAKHPVQADPWLLDAVQRSGPGIKVLAGRRVVAVCPEEYLAGVDANRLAALFDAAELAVERIAGVRPPAGKPTKDDPRPRDLSGRFLVGMWPLAKPTEDQAFDGWAGPEDEKSRGLPLAFAVAGTLASSAVDAATNHRARIFSPAVANVLRDLATREIGEPAAVASADAYRVKAKEQYDTDWGCGCLPGEWTPRDAPLAHLFFLALAAEAGAKRLPADALHAYLTEPRRYVASERGRIASARDLAMEPLAATLSPAAADVFRRAGVLPVGRAFEQMKERVIAEDQCQEAASLSGDATRDMAARTYRAAAETIGASIAADEMVLEALELEEKDDAKKARAAAQKMGLIEGFDFLGPLPDARQRNDVAAASRLLPLAVATAPGRHPLKAKEPVEVSLKWAEVKDPYGRLVERTPWGDKRGLTWGSTAVATLKWTKDLGRLVRLRPCRGDWSDVVVLADGRPLDKWPDGSVLAPGAKGTEIVLSSPARITCSVPWRDAKSVEQDLAAAASEKETLLALRPWAERRVAAALPHLTTKLTALADADLVREITVLAPYRGGDAATCDAMLARAKDHPAVLAAYLEICRGSRDVALLTRLVGLATADGAAPEVVSGVQYVLDGALFRKVTEKGADLAAVWERGRKWMAASGFAEAEEIRDLYDATPCFRVLAEPKAWGRACVAPSAWNDRRGEGYLLVDVPDAPGSSFLAVRWQPTANGRLTLRGYVTDGKKPKPFSFDMPGTVADKPEWVVDVFDLGSLPHGRVVFAIDDPCASGCKIDAFAVGPKPE